MNRIKAGNCNTTGLLEQNRGPDLSEILEGLMKLGDDIEDIGSVSNLQQLEILSIGTQIQEWAETTLETAQNIEQHNPESPDIELLKEDVAFLKQLNQGFFQNYKKASETSLNSSFTGNMNYFWRYLNQ